jgi:hypothetical protein
MIKLLIDKEVYAEPFKMFYGTDYCAIGHKWAQGGAQHLAEEMHAWDPEWAWFCTDISKLDQRLHPGLLTLIFTSMLAMYDQTQTPHAYSVLRAFICYSADDIAATLIKWTGLTYRIIVGVMFSGLFGTSIGDTLYVSVALKCAFRHFQRLNKLPRGTPMPVVKVYGDNVMIAWTKELLARFILGDNKMPTTGFLATYLVRSFGLPVKDDETFFFDKFFTQVSERYDPVSCKWRTMMTVPGPCFLKRHFVERKFGGRTWAMPFRPVRDYYVRSITTNHTDKSPEIFVSRWCGLLLDTCGTNKEAHSFLMYLIARHVMSFRRGDFNNFKSMADWYVSKVPEYWINRVIKLGLNPAELTTTLQSTTKIASLFTPPGFPVLE